MNQLSPNNNPPLPYSPLNTYSHPHKEGSLCLSVGFYMN